MTGFFLVVLLFVVLFYGVILFQRVRYDQSAVDGRLKDIIATSHRRIDQLDLLQTRLMPMMAEEDTTWAELAEARRTLIQVLSEHDVDRIVTADAELNRCIYDMKERMKVYPECSESEEINDLDKGIRRLEGILADELKAYNSSVDEFNRKMEQLPRVLVTRLFSIRPYSRFVHDPATVVDQNLEAVVPEE